MNSMNVVFLQEIQRYNNMTIIIKNDIDSLI